jgi:hypothetical protein
MEIVKPQPRATPPSLINQSITEGDLNRVQVRHRTPAAAAHVAKIGIHLAQCSVVRPHRSVHWSAKGSVPGGPCCLNGSPAVSK